MARFAPAVEKILNAEGGYQNDVEDLGNYNAYDASGNFVAYNQRKGQTLRAGTNRGISAGLYSSLRKREVSPEEMQAISRNKAIEIYRQVYWNKMKGDQITNQRLAELILDSYVNHGSTGIKLLQKVLNRMGKTLEVDGRLGNRTLSALHQVELESLYNGYIEARR